VEGLIEMGEGRAGGMIDRVLQLCIESPELFH
jgi:hypothetical protein